MSAASPVTIAEHLLTEQRAGHDTPNSTGNLGGPGLSPQTPAPGRPPCSPERAPGHEQDGTSGPPPSDAPVPGGRDPAAPQDEKSESGETHFHQA